MRIILDYFRFITNIVRYDQTSSNADHLMYGRYSPSKDLIHYQYWKYNGELYQDNTNYKDYWFYYYPRRHQNIPSNENIYDLEFIRTGDATSKLWDYNRFIL